MFKLIKWNHDLQTSGFTTKLLVFSNNMEKVLAEFALFSVEI